MNKKIGRIFIFIIISIIIELLIFNYGAIRSFINGSERQIEYQLESSYKNNKNNYILTINNLDEILTSVNINYKNDYKEIIKYETYFISEDDTNYKKIKDKYMLANKNNTYIQLDTHTNAKEVKIFFQSEKQLEIDSVIINHSNLNFSIVRILIVFAIVNLIYYIKTKKIYKIEYNKNSKQQFLVIFGILLFTIIFITIYYMKEIDVSQYNMLQEDILDQEQIMQTEALLNGSISLLVKPPQELIDLQDPYNHGLREENNIEYMYDTAYYNGNYYSYFGIAPIITLIMPIKIIFDMYLPLKIYTLLFILIAIFLIFLVYKKIVEKYIKKISLFNFILGFITIVFGSSLLLLLRGEKYDIVCASGITFFLLAIFLLLDLNEESRYRKLKLFFAGLSTGLIVLSKPSYILYYLILSYLIIMYLKNIKLDRKTKIYDMLIYFIPLSLLAIFQMTYNYLRFDSIFEFGAKYQLTSYNMIYAMTPTLGKIIEGIGKYIFTLPIINIFDFPFVVPNFNSTNTALNELCYQNKIVGLAAIPIVWVILLIGELKNNIKTKEDKELKNLINISLITVLLFIILNTVSAGICDAYSVEFKIIAVLVCTIIWLKILENKENKNILNKIFLIVCIATLLLFIPLSLTTESNLLLDMKNETTVYLKNFFEFWT